MEGFASCAFKRLSRVISCGPIRQPMFQCPMAAQGPLTRVPRDISLFQLPWHLQGFFSFPIRERCQESLAGFSAFSLFHFVLQGPGFSAHPPPAQRGAGRRQPLAAEAASSLQALPVIWREKNPTFSHRWHVCCAKHPSAPRGSLAEPMPLLLRRGTARGRCPLSP